MSAELLRRASAVLRERAEAATPRPWKRTTGITPAILGPREPEDMAGGPASILRANLPVINGHRRREANVAYAATMHPSVGLALADLLDIEADRLDHTTACDAPLDKPCNNCLEPHWSFVAAESIARLILGRP